MRLILNKNINIKDEVFIKKLKEILQKIKDISIFQDIFIIRKNLEELDNKILENNFLDVIYYLYGNEKNEKLLDFLCFFKNEAQARDLIDGLLENDNDENITIDLKDLESLINCVCFIKEIQVNNSNINNFLSYFILY